jgi:hypothetical protein
MPHQNPNREELVYRLALVSLGSSYVLAQHKGPAMSLPRVSIPMWTRPAAQVQKAIGKSWGVSSFVLDFLNNSEGLPLCVVARLLGSLPPAELVFVALSDLPASELTDSERSIVEAICANDTGNRGPFSRIGWMDEAAEWMRVSVGHEVEFTGQVEQYNASGTYALLRHPTQGGSAYWLKATGKPNLHEFEITATLSAICPQFLPPLVAMRQDWNAWIMEDIGEPLSQQMGVRHLKHAVVSMATLQKKTLGYTEQLLGAGATDQRMGVLRGHVGEIIAYLEEAMEYQTSTKTPRLGVSRLREIGVTVESACEAMEELGIPETVIHNDVNRGNILVRGNDCVFTDWCETCVGNPFVTFQQLLLLLPPDMEKAEAHRFTLMRAYKRCWLDSLTSWQLDQAFAIVPLLAIASYLYGRGEWLRSPHRHAPDKQSYARGLARHMDRATRIPSLMEALCN